MAVAFWAVGRGIELTLCTRSTLRVVLDDNGVMLAVTLFEFPLLGENFRRRANVLECLTLNVALPLVFLINCSFVGRGLTDVLLPDRPFVKS